MTPGKDLKGTKTALSNIRNVRPRSKRHEWALQVTRKEGCNRYGIEKGGEEPKRGIEQLNAGATRGKISIANRS